VDCVVKSVHISLDKWHIECKVIISALDIWMWKITWTYWIEIYSSWFWSRCFNYNKQDV